MIEKELCLMIEKERGRLNRATSIRGYLAVGKRAEILRRSALENRFGIAIENNACEVRLLAERKIGELLKYTVRRGGDRRSTRATSVVTLKRLGLTYKQSFRFRQLASFTAESISLFVESSTILGHRVSTNQLLRLAQSNRRRHITRR